ncbi:hypothetical protein FKM82_019126 [Ascaphus truei]
MGILYINVTNYNGVRITFIRKGSIVVEHVVLLEVDFAKYREQYAEAVERLNETLRHSNCTTIEFTKETLCFVPNTEKINNNEIDLTDLCSELNSIPPELHQYFYGVNISNQLVCVTNCSTDNVHNIDCNQGQCSVTRAGPNCYCDSSDQFWYTGHRCQTAISKPGVYGGVGAGLAVLLIVIVALAVISCRRRRGPVREK